MSTNNPASGIIVLAFVVVGIVLMGVAISTVGFAFLPDTDRGAMFVGALIIALMIVVGGMIAGSARQRPQQVQRTIPTQGTVRVVIPPQVQSTVPPSQPVPPNTYTVGGIPSDLERNR